MQKTSPNPKPANRYSPGALGFRMPAEYEEHERCWMVWPHREQTYVHDFAQAKREFADVAHAIRRFEPVTMIAAPTDMAEARNMLGSDIELLELPVNDAWGRDTGPCFVVNDDGDLAGVDLNHNCWGGNYEPYDADAQLARRMLRHLSVPHFSTQLTAEGGGITVDGEGTMITTESCLLNDNRNAGWTKAEVEAEIEHVFGITKVIWLPGSEEDTESNGHVDGIAAFVGSGKVLVEYRSDLDMPDATRVNANFEALQGQTDAKGRPITTIKIEEASVSGIDRNWFCRTYVNSYIANGAVILPQYNVPEDGRAREIFRDLFPEREAVFVEIFSISAGSGGIHCITQQQPKPR
ncbi:MAG: agmatine deiminase family protein [Pseudomonadota bacterium]